MIGSAWKLFDCAYFVCFSSLFLDRLLETRDEREILAGN